MNSPTWHAEKAATLVITGGFFLHLINYTRAVTVPGAGPGDVVSRPVDLALFILMAWTAAGMVLRHRAVFETYDLSAPWRRVVYWIIATYMTLSLPGHVYFLVTGDPAFFEVFPAWFSLAILPVYVLIVTYFVTLAPRAGFGRRATGLKEPRRMRQHSTLLLVNGLILGAVALLQFGLDFAGYYAGFGPTGPTLHGNLDTIGFAEAHGLAAILAALFVLRRHDGYAGWHAVAAITHLLLGTCNILFWPLFVEAGLVPMGIGATALHIVFFGLQTWALLRPAGTPRASV